MQDEEQNVIQSTEEIPLSTQFGTGGWYFWL